MMGNLFNMFGPSPIRPIEQHMHKVYHCAKALLPFFDAVLSENFEEIEKLHTLINTFEREADDIKRELRLHLPTGLFLPVNRSDVLELIRIQDRIANKAQDIAGLVLGRNMKIPFVLHEDFMPFLTRVLDAAKQACRAINELDQLLETGFRGNEVKIVEEMIVTLDEIEHDTDKKLSSIRQSIFKLEASVPALEVMFLYKLVQWIGDLADHAQNVGGRLQILIAR